MRTAVRLARETLLLGALLAGSSPAFAEAGKVLFALGRVEIQRGEVTLTAIRGSTVEVGDMITAAPTAIAQIRLNDGAMLGLRRGAQMIIEDFQMPVEPPEPAEPAVAAPQRVPVARTPGRSVFRLLRGAFRTVTGLIGRDPSDQYQVNTPVATIGIRGTDYSARLCSGDCGTQPDGLYVGVSDGEIFVTNDVGQMFLSDNQYAYVKDATTPPEQQLAPPDPLETPIEPEEEEAPEEEEEPPATFEQAAAKEPAPSTDDSKTTTTGTVKTLETQDPEGTYELQPVAAVRSLAFATGPIQSRSTFAGVSAGDASAIQLSSAGNVVAFPGTSPTGESVVTYSLGTSQNTNTGFDPATGIRWGRWSGGSANVGTQSLNLASQSLHWIYGPATETKPVIPISGSASYVLVGNTNPTDNLGNIGFLGSASLSANFTNQTVSSTLDIGINNEVWQASGSGSILSGSPFFAGGYSVSVTGPAREVPGSGSGSFAGFFTDNAAAAGMGYSLNSGNTSVSGSAAFVRGSSASTSASSAGAGGP